MRRHFQSQPDLRITPIEKIRLPLESRDELPPILAGLHWVWTHPTLKAGIFALLGSQGPGRQKGHRPARHGPVANPGAGHRAPGLGRRLGPHGTHRQL